MNGAERPPQIYADSVNVGVGPYGVNLRFGVTGEGEEVLPAGTVRLSPQLAYVMARIIMRALATAGEQGLGYAVPDEVLVAAGLKVGGPDD